MKIISMYKDSRFAKVVIPKLLIEKIHDNLDECVKHKTDTEMRKYLHKKYNLTLEDVFEELNKDDSILVSKNGSNYVIEINPNTKIKTEQELNTMIRLIDYGVLEVRGLHIVDEALKYIQLNLENIYTIYMKGGLKYGY